MRKLDKNLRSKHNRTNQNGKRANREEVKKYVDDFCKHYDINKRELSLELGKARNYLSCMLDGNSFSLTQKHFKELKKKMEALYR